MLYQLSYGPLAFSCTAASYFSVRVLLRTSHGQGQNRTADTMIFSHVLYQLSYLAQTKKPPEPIAVRAGTFGVTGLPALRSRPNSRAPRVGVDPEAGALHDAPSRSRTWETPPEAALHEQ